MFYPILVGLGFDGIWVGILIILEVEIASITPPIGMNVYVLKSVVGDLISIGDLFRGAAPFFFINIIAMIILVSFPILSLWLPSMMYK